MPALGRATRFGIHHAAKRMLGILAEDGGAVLWILQAFDAIVETVWESI